VAAAPAAGRQPPQQQPEPQKEGATDEGTAVLDVVVAPALLGGNGSGDAANAALLEQMRAMQQIMQEQQRQLAQLRASPQQSPQQSAQGSPQLSPRLAASAAGVSTQPGQATAAAAAAAAGQASRFAKKEPRAHDLREYDGASGAKLDAWLDELALAIDLFELNAREAVKFASSRLRGAALQWWLALGAPGKAAVSDPEALAKGLRARFQPITTAKLAREQLRGLRQGARPVNDYIAEFQRLHALLPDMSEADALFAFESGLSPALAEKLRVQGVETVAAAIMLAARVGGLHQHSASHAAAGANQMEIDDGAGALEERVARSVLNALSAQGIGAKMQTQRGYDNERAARGGGRGGRGGRFGAGARSGAGPVIPGVPPEVVEQRRAAGQCFRCGSGEHQGRQCPNAVSAFQQGK
jgi:hypothetical protein